MFNTFVINFDFVWLLNLIGFHFLSQNSVNCSMQQQLQRSCCPLLVFFFIWHHLWQRYYYSLALVVAAVGHGSSLVEGALCRLAHCLRLCSKFVCIYSFFPLLCDCVCSSFSLSVSFCFVRVSLGCSISH